MSRNSEYQFVSTDVSTLTMQMIAEYEALTGMSMKPASPERLFVQWVASIILQERVMNNYTGNQNLPSRAEGENLDQLGEVIYNVTRPMAQAAKCTVRFLISQPQSSSILIPAGTRVTDVGNTLSWKTTADAYIAIGDLSVEVMVQCQTVATVGNGYAVGQINTVVDMYDYCSGCSNITQSDGGADRATDDEYYELMRASLDGYSTAGAQGGYIYLAKGVSTEISDVVANSPSAGCVNLYILMANGTLATDEIKKAVLAACTDKFVRPLTDYVSTADAEVVSYDITLTYYIPANASESSEQMQKAVADAVDSYISWQCAKLGRDINPSQLIGLLMKTGVKRVDLSSPTFSSLRDGSDNTAPQIARVGTVSLTNGGYEDE